MMAMLLVNYCSAVMLTNVFFLHYIVHPVIFCIFTD